LCAAGIKYNGKIVPIVQGLRSGGGGIAAKTTKYEKVAAVESNDEEWGWGDENENVSNNGDDDDWGDDDWEDDDIDTISKNGIELTQTTPPFSSKNSYNNAHLKQRSSSPDENDFGRPVTAKPIVKGMGLKTASGRSTSTPIRSAGSAVSGMSLQKKLPQAFPAKTLSPGTIGGMTMGITSLGSKKKPVVAAKPRKKKLLGASDDDLFASMGFGGPPSASKPKPKPKATLPSKFASRSPSSATSTSKPKPTTLGASTAFAAKPKPLASTFTKKPAPVFLTPAPVSAPALIPDGFGDDDLDLDLGDVPDGFGDDDLDLDLRGDDDDDLGLGDAGGGDNNWEDDDSDLNDLLS